MEITLYGSVLCPRCFMAKKHLIALQKKNLDIDISIQNIDIMVSPQKAWSDGIRMIPAIKIGDSILSGLYLNKSTIQRFIQKNIDSI